MKTLNELQPLIVQWAKDRNINLPECAPKQRLKLIEECGELASAILKNDIDKQKDAIGDIFVVLVILAKLENQRFGINLSLNYSPLNDNDFLLASIISNYVYTRRSIGIYAIHNIAKNLNLDLTECANIAWNEIKDRKGKTVNNVFIKG